MVIMAKRLPDEREAIEGAGVATTTAASLLSTADLAADVDSFGIARSLAVLALEESVKARTLGAIAAAAAQGRPPGSAMTT
jgi:AbiV family abortive infection protein